MPSLTWSQALTANQLGFNPVSGWQFERVPSSFINGAYVSVLERCTDINARLSIFTGSQNILQRSPVSSGATAGVVPTLFNTPVVDWRSSPDDLLQVLNDEVAGGTPTVVGIITIEPL
jgi:hypothetical protein